VDREEARLREGEVVYAQGTRDALRRLAQADLMGFTLPRGYGGINMPKTMYSAAIEIISRADASLMNLFGLQEIADTICKFGTEDQKARYLPRFCRGETTGAMALTEPDAGSDLQSARLKASLDEDGIWRLSGVKRFITNGCAGVSLVLARSEEGTTGGRGLSVFIYERDGNMKVRRLEDKLGIHGSPTCEMQFTRAPAELLGRRKMGLIKYTMSLMNGARAAVAAQATGIAEAACREAYDYASARRQFKRPIKDFPAVGEMLTDMRVSIEAARSLLFETSIIVDISEGLEESMERHPERKADIKNDAKRYGKYASFFTPALKIFATEMANRVCSDALQVHGGPGYTRDFDVERHFRDVRITNIYEGTTQLQVLAAIGGVVTGTVFERLNDYEESHDFSPVADLFATARRFRTHLESAVSHVKERNDAAFQEYHARRLVDMAVDTILGYLLCIDALASERKRKVARLFLAKAEPRVASTRDYILSDDTSAVELSGEILEGEGTESG
jgi:alkylation response protein AidB-like acyl-CoA dehydrogenase